MSFTYCIREENGLWRLCSLPCHLEGNRRHSIHANTSRRTVSGGSLRLLTLWAAITGAVPGARAAEAAPYGMEFPASVALPAPVAFPQVTRLKASTFMACVGQ